MALVLSEIDYALTTPCPVAPPEPVRGESESADDFTIRQHNHAPLVSVYQLEKAKRDKSNRKCMMVI